MSKRGRKGAAPLFVKKQRLQYILQDDESDEEVQRVSQKNPAGRNKIQEDQNLQTQRDLDGAIIDLTNDGSQKKEWQEPKTKSPKVSSPIDLLKHSNFKEVVQVYVQKHFPANEVIDEQTLRYFHDLYLNQPTSRRCPEMNLSRVDIKPPKPSPEEEELLRKYNIKPCIVPMNEGNVVYSIERRIYGRFWQNNPITGEHTPLIKPEILHFMVLEYFSLINMKPLFEYVPRDQMLMIDTLVEVLFKTLDARTPPLKPNDTVVARANKTVADASRDLHIEELNISEECSGEDVSQKLEILSFTFKDQHQCAAKRIEEKFIEDGKLEIPVTLHTLEGEMDITLRGDDIGRFLLLSSSACKVIKDIAAKLTEDYPVNKVMLQKFSGILSGALKSAKENPRNEKIIRKYIQHEIENDELLNYIEVIKK